ncbi:MAG: glycerol kinase GlpK [Pseudomonadota bacterium]|nr:glycerol kinase GlpK [Pseudomonadota bacterium]
MDCVLALDQGTTSSRAILFDPQGPIMDLEQKEFPQHFPRPGWVEHDPRDIWNSQREVALAVLGRMDGDSSRIRGMGISNQRETTVVWDRRTGEPVYNAIVWQDRRTANLCDQLRAEGHEDTIREKTGLLLDPYLAGTKIRWILDNVADVRRRAERGELAFGTVDCWLVWNLTGGRVHVTDASNASRTLLFNIHTGEWDDDLLAVLDIPRDLLPEVRSCSEVYGESPELGNIPIAGMAGDQQAALFGQTCFEPGMAKNTYGTGCFLLMNTGDTPAVSRHNLLTTIAWQIGGHTEYALEGSVFVGGAVVQWLRDGLGIIGSAGESERLAASVEDSGGVVLVPAFTGLGAPHWDPYARGAMLGITRGTTAAHIARAGLESIAFQVGDLLEVMNRDSGITLDELRVDGGASQNDLLLQIQADLLNVPVVRPKMIETTAFGAACLAGLATGVWRDRKELNDVWQSERRFEPKMEDDLRKRMQRQWSRALERSRHWIDSREGSDA